MWLVPLSVLAEKRPHCQCFVMSAGHWQSVCPCLQTWEGKVAANATPSLSGGAQGSSASSAAAVEAEANSSQEHASLVRLAWQAAMDARFSLS